MSKWDAEKKIEQPGDIGRTIRKFEEHENSIRAHGFQLTPDQFNLIVDLTAINNHVVRSFNWVKFINDVRSTNGGYNIICDNEMSASNLFDYIGFDLQTQYKTDKLATTYRGKVIRYMRVPQTEGREMTEGTKELLNRLKSTLAGI